VTTARLPERPRLECEPPLVLCQPGTFDQTIVDTSSSPQIRTSFYLSITKVLGLQTDADEFGVAFPMKGNGSSGLATIRRSDAGSYDELVSVRFTEITSATVATAIAGKDLEGSIGRGATIAGTMTMQFAAEGRAAVRGDYDLFSGSYAGQTISSIRRNDVSSFLAWDAQPALSPDGRTLYFASNRSGGLGGTDLYVSRLDDADNWSPPQNLGPGVNTPCDELSPWVSGDGKWLYFSSAGHQTVGGYDLFRAPISRNQIGGASNLGKPINTPADEIFPSAPANADPDTLLYYSSNQTGSSRFDVYVLHKRKRAVIGKTREELPPKLVKLTGTVETSQGVPVDSAIVKLQEHAPPRHQDSTVTSRDGRYEFQIEEGKRYEISAGSQGTLFGENEVYVRPGSDSVVVRRDITIPDTITFRVNFPFNNATDPYEFTLDDRGLPSEERWLDVIDRMADFLRKQRKGSGAIRIVGHTDPVGSDQFNVDLGRRRAEFVEQELVRRGVPAELLVVRSEGESKPLARHPNEPEELYYARLRRVELVREEK